MTLPRQPENPLWQVAISDGTARNPLNFYCAPNSATPDYVSYRSFDMFVAYGFIQSWLQPNEYGGWMWLQKNDIRWLREYFLQSLECVLLSIYEGEFGDTIAPDGKRYEGFDSGSEGSLTVVDHDDEKYRTEEHMFQWQPRFLEPDGTLAFDLTFTVLESPKPNGVYSEDNTIWLAPEGYADRENVRKVIANARKVNWEGTQVNGVAEENPNLTKLWEKVLECVTP